MGAMLVGILTGAAISIIGIIYIIISFIVLMFAPGAIARFLVKKRQFTLPERKKFRRYFALIYCATYIIQFILDIIEIISGDMTLSDILLGVIIVAVPLSILLFTNTLILKIPGKNNV